MPKSRRYFLRVPCGKHLAGTEVFPLRKSDWIKDQLFESFKRDINKISTGGLAQWYKEYLVKQSEGVSLDVSP